MSHIDADLDNLDLRSARLEWHDGYLLLVLDIGGRTARIVSETKEGIYHSRLVFIGEDFDDLIPDRTYTDPSSGGRTKLVGFTDDPRIFALMRQFIAGSLQPGPVPIPSV